MPGLGRVHVPALVIASAKPESARNARSPPTTATIGRLTQALDLPHVRPAPPGTYEVTMPGLLPDVDPDGLLEYSVVFTDRSLNHMSKAFQGVMRDLSAMLKQVYHAQAVAIVPGGGTFGMEAVARQFATGKKTLMIRNGWFSYRWTQIFEMGAIPAESVVLKARPVAEGPQAPFAPAPIEEVVAAIARHGRTSCSRRMWKPRPASSCPTTTCAPWPTRCMRSADCSCSIASPRARSGWTWQRAGSTS